MSDTTNQSGRRIARPPGPNNPEGCPFCGAELSGRVAIKKGDAVIQALHCPSDGDLLLEPDLVLALPTLEAAQRDAVHQYLLNLRRATDAPETLSLAKIRFL